MSNVAKLKKKAAEFEAKKQFDKALGVYVELLDAFEEHPQEIDVALFNRVGDLMLKQGNVADAVDYYERAVDHYAEGGFFNNAIALCNKILRTAPGRTSVYYKLGKISAQKGFKADAKQNFLEYADRMRSSGNMDEAFRALNEFADLCPDQDDIRQMLADQLSKLGRKDESVEQLQKLHERYTSEGRDSEAAATAARMKAIDPSVEPRSGTGKRRPTTADLVFIDLSDEPPPPPKPATGPAKVEHGDVADISPKHRPSVPGLMSASELKVEAPTVPGLEPTAPDFAPPAIEELNVEPTAADGLIWDPATSGSTPVVRSPTPTHGADQVQGGGLDFLIPAEPPTAPRPSQEQILGNLPLESVEASGLGAPPAPRHTSPTPLDGIPLMDVDIPEPPRPRTEPARRASAPMPELVLDEELLPVPERPPAQPLEVERPAAESLAGQAAAEETSLEFMDLDLIEAEEPAAAPRSSTMLAAKSVDLLRAAVEGEPENWSLRRELGEVLIESGDRDAGVVELEAAMAGAEGANELDSAFSIAEEIGRLDPTTVRHHQKRVEYAFRLNDKPRLVEAYLSLASALTQAEQSDKARAVYQRVLDIAPDDIRAQAALESFAAAEPAPAPAPPPPRATRATTSIRKSGLFQQPTAPPPKPAAPVATGSDDFVNLGDWLRDDESPKDTRMVVDEEEPTGDENADFQDMLRKFKQGVAQNVEEEDHQSHYDLGVAYKEMGLVDEAIAEFQKALRAPENRVRTYEALGQCFIEKEQYPIAHTVLSRALAEPAGDDQLIGVLYLLGRAAEIMNRPDEAMGYYQRVFVVDIEFRDVGERLAGVERAAR